MSLVSNIKYQNDSMKSEHESLNEKNKLKKIRNTLKDLVKAEILSFNTIKVRICEEELENNDTKIIIPLTFKKYYEDLKNRKNSQIEEEDVNSSDFGSDIDDESDLIFSE